MMLPTASPLVLLYGAAARRSAPDAASQQTYALAAGYLFAWTAFSLAATILQRVLTSLLLVSPMMEAANHRVSAGLLLIAGVYQWTPLKHACLRTCQSPLGFLMARWRGGTSGAFRMGIDHGIYCVGCCWALMLLLFAGGVMSRMSAACANRSVSRASSGLGVGSPLGWLCTTSSAVVPGVRHAGTNTSGSEVGVLERVPRESTCQARRR